MKKLDDIIKEAASSRAVRRALQNPAKPTAAVAPETPASASPAPAAKQRAKDTAADPTAEITPSGKAPTGISNTNADKPVIGPAAPGGKPGATPGKPHVAPVDFAAVSEMQKAILAFGQIAAGVDAFKQAPQGTGTQTLTSGEYAGGHDPFSKFLFSNYLDKGNEAKAGKGVVSIENLDTSTRMDTATNRGDVGSLRNWVETIQHVGSPTKGGEYKPDGAWGPRTNNALKAIADFAKMMFSFSDDMGTPVDDAHKQGLEVFTKNIPPLEGNGLVQTANVGKLAKAFTGYVNNLGAVFQGFKAKVMENPSWKSFLAQDKALIPASKEALTPHEQATILGNKGKAVNVQMNDAEKATEYKAYQNLTLDDLASKESFVQFLKAHNIEAEHPEKILAELNWVRERISAPKTNALPPVDEVYPVAQPAQPVQPATPGATQ